MAARQQITIELVDKVTKSLGNIENKLNRLTKNTNKTQSAFAGAGLAVKGFVGALAAREVIQFANAIIDATDELLQMENKLRLVTNGQEGMNSAMDALRRISSSTRSDLGDTVDLYSKLSVATESQNISQERLLDVTSKFQKALKISGADVNTAAGAIRQFGQAMASGQVRGDEFNSIVEAMGPALAIMARETGLNVGELRRMSQAGELTSETFFKMIENSTELDKAFAQTKATTAELELELSKSFKNFLADVDEAIGLTDRYRRSLIQSRAILDKLTGTFNVFNLKYSELMQGLRDGTIETGDVIAALEYKLERVSETGLGAMAGALMDLTEGAGTTDAMIQHLIDTIEALKDGTHEYLQTTNEAEDGQERFFNSLRKSVGAAQKFAEVDYRTELEKANQEVIDAELVLDHLRLALRENIITMEEYIPLLRATEKHLGLARIELAELRNEANKLELSGFEKFFQSTIENATETANELVYTQQAITKLKEELDAGRISIDVYAAAMDKLVDSTDNGKDATEDLKNEIENLQKKYEEFIYTSTEIARRAYEDDLKTFQSALEAKIIEQEEYNKLVAGAEKALQSELDTIRKEQEQKDRERRDKALRDEIAKNEHMVRLLSQYNQDNIYQKEAAEGKIQEAVNKRIEFEKKSELEKTQFAISQAGDAFEALGKYNKQAFEASKALRIVETVMSTYQAATLALASYPPPFNFIAAAAVTAAGFANVAAIRSSQYQGRQRGGALNIGQGTVVGEDGPELIVPKQPGTVIPREVAEAINGMNRGDENVIVNFNISTVDAEGFDELLIQRRGTITGIINQALQKRGKQGVV